MREGERWRQALCADEDRAHQWTDPLPPHRLGDLSVALHAKALCAPCPVLADCRDWAAGFRWSHVVIAGWRAPQSFKVARRPPWADVRGTRSGTDTREGAA